ncbi:MAG TPA: GNAT family N-acyltransferase [Chitinispirillaceae bacterium]|jgi:putative hemolysin|nr:GNAT family N-acyltransferase [Chitinispirillaceae bacterium]
MLRKHGFQISKLMPVPQIIFKPGTLKFRAFKQKVRLNIERENFTIKTVENNEELAKALRLRYEVFYKELLEKKLITGMDIDRFDFKCDHLVIIDKKTGNYIGTYRLISSLFHKKFYSSTEFHLDDIINLSGTKLELGRACVHRDYRTGSSIALLWRGITNYMKETGTKYLFGCSSVKTTDIRVIASIYKHFQENGKVSDEINVSPKGKFRMRNFRKTLESITPQEIADAREKIPPLLNSYINMGSMICGEPALDKKFKCADFLTLFDVEKSEKKVHRKYQI